MRLGWLRAKHVWIVFGASMLFNAWMFSVGPYAEATAGERSLPDERFGTSLGDLTEFMFDMARDDDWAAAYRIFVPFDMLYAGLQGAWLAGFVALGARAWPRLPMWSVWLPLAAAVADWLETLGLLYMTFHPGMGLVGAPTWLFMHVKFVAYVASFLLALAVAAFWISKPVRRGRQPKAVRKTAAGRRV